MDLTRCSAVELASLVRAREVTAIEVVDAVLDRAESLEPTVNAFITIDRDGARAAAAHADERAAAGEWLGPLHGVPFSVKDLLPTGGLRTTYGSQACADNVPDRDAVAVARVRAAGGILIGRTATPELAASLQTTSALNGTTRNPWDLERSAGGSSGGAGAAIAAGLGPLALSTDGAGSARVPGSVCGVLGLKPTLGRVPHEAWPLHYSNNSSVSINSRSAADAALLLRTIEGPTTADPWATRSPREPDDDAAIDALYIGRPCGRAPSPEVAAAVSGLVDALADAGLSVEHADDDHDPTGFRAEMVPGILAPNLAARVRAMEPTEQRSLEEPLQQLLSPAYRPDAVELQQLEIERSQLYDRVDALLGYYEFLITPTVLDDPPSADAVIDADWWTHLGVANFTGHPAISVPCGFSAAGLPIGTQIIGRWDADHRLLELAERIHSIHPWTGFWPDAM